jgi:hypothetical protein
VAIDISTAALAGLLAGAVMVAVRLAIRAAGVKLRMDVMLMWSTLFHVHGGAERLVGLGMHLAVSAVVGLLYASGLALLGVGDGLLLWGVIGALIHYLIAGAFLVIAPDMNRDMPEVIPAPGIFAMKLGIPDAIGFLAGHLGYGVSFTVLYGLLHPAGGSAVVF